MTNDERKVRDLTKHFRALTVTVGMFVEQVDVLMRSSESPERGKAIATLVNQLEMANDRARYFGLGVDYRTDSKP